jgi:hypothetical protein
MACHVAGHGNSDAASPEVVSGGTPAGIAAFTYEVVLDYLGQSGGRVLTARWRSS